MVIEIMLSSDLNGRVFSARVSNAMATLLNRTELPDML